MRQDVGVSASPCLAPRCYASRFLLLARQSQSELCLCACFVRRFSIRWELSSGVLHATSFRSGFIRSFGAHYIRAAKRYTALHIPHTAAYGLMWGYREDVSSRHIHVRQSDTLHCKTPALILASERPPFCNPIRSAASMGSTSIRQTVPPAPLLSARLPSVRSAQAPSW